MTTSPTPTGWISSPAHRRWLEAEGDRLLDFAAASRHPAGGFAWLGEDGTPDLERPVELWISARMTHVHSLGHLLGRPGATALADHGVRSLQGRLRDATHGGWYAAVGPDGPTTRDKTAYEHAFVVLAASSATAAGRPGADALLDEAVRVMLEHFWDDEHAMVVEQWDESFTVLDGYRGANSNMHTVEALLAAADVLGDDGLRQRALRIVTRVVHDLAAGNSWRIPEHFDAHWAPQPDYNVGEPAHPFRPFGATIGHAFEWARLTVSLRSALGDDAPGWMLDDAAHLFRAGVEEGWEVDGSPGFVYTVDWSGRPVVRERMHWVAAEAVMAAAALHAVTGDAETRREHERRYEQWWQYAATHLLDVRLGSWRHELSPANEPSSLTWIGKPDIYHAFQATLAPRLPLSPSYATALGRGLLDSV